MYSDGTVTWNLPDLDPGDGGSVSFQVSVLTDGMYENMAEMTFFHVIERMVTSNTTVTHRDTEPPTVTIIGPDGAMADGATTYDETPTFEYNVAGDPVIFECRVDAGAFEPCPMPLGMFTTVPLSLGLHTVYVRVTDLAGNIDTAARNFTVDTLVVMVIPPTPTIVNASGPNPPSFYFTTDHMGPTVFLCALDLDPFVPCASPWTPAGPLNDGPHVFQVQALDVADNAGPIAEHNFIVDTEAPIATVVPPTPTIVTAEDPNPPTFYFTSSEPAIFWCALDLDPLVPGCASPWTPPVPPLADGPHTFHVQAEDAAGNLGPIAQHDFLVDTGTP